MRHNTTKKKLSKGKGDIHSHVRTRYQEWLKERGLTDNLTPNFRRRHQALRGEGRI